MLGSRFDDFAAADPPADMATPADMALLLTTARRCRRAFQEHADFAKDCESQEPDREVANQMAEPIAILSGGAYHLQKAIDSLEKALNATAGISTAMTRMIETVAGVRARR